LSGNYILLRVHVFKADFNVQEELRLYTVHNIYSSLDKFVSSDWMSSTPNYFSLCLLSLYSRRGRKSCNKCNDAQHLCEYMVCGGGSLEVTRGATNVMIQINEEEE